MKNGSENSRFGSICCFFVVSETLHLNYYNVTLDAIVLSIML